MAEPEPNTNVWYLARDGQQYGPLTDLELSKLIELGHLREADLVWTPTFPEWKPASVAIAMLGPRAAPPAPAPQPQPPHSARPHAQPQPAGSHSDWRGHPAGPGGIATQQAAQRDAEMRQAAPATTDRPAGHGPALGHGPTAGHSVGHDVAPGQNVGLAGARPDAGRPLEPTRGSPLPQPRERPSRLDEDDDEFAEAPRSRGGTMVRAAAAIVFLALIGGGAWFAVQNQDTILAMIDGIKTDGGTAPVVRADRTDAVKVRPTTTQSIPPAKAERVAILESELWQKIAKVFPDWETQKRQEIAAMQNNGMDAKTINGEVVKEIAKLRRQHATEALAASPNALRSLASAFLANLRTMAAMDPEICYAFISNGEAASKVLPLLSDNAAGESIHKQLRLMVDAIVDGRDSPNTYLPPRRDEYAMISQELGKMGWTNEDMRLFGDAQALSKAPPPKVCQLVTDWFTAQLMVSDPAIQSRLLVQSLRPVVGG